MTALAWFSLLHPLLVILFVFPVVGATVRLGILVREHRLGITQQPAPVPREHVDHGRWLTAAVVVAVLIALVYSFSAKALSADTLSAETSFAGGASRFALLMLAAAGTLGALLALLQVKQASLRASFSLITWAGLLGLGSQSEIWRVSDNPFSGAFWGSHYWGGVLLTGLLLLNLAARPEITRELRWRRLHVTSNILILLLLAVQAISGCRDLLQIGAG